MRDVLTDLNAAPPSFSAVRDYPQALRRQDGWILEDPALVRLCKHLMSQGMPLERLCPDGRIYRGVTDRSKHGLRRLTRSTRDALVDS